MKLSKRRFTTFALFVYVWLCCCAADCPFPDGYYGTEFEAIKPAGVDSLEMRVIYNDSVIAERYCGSEKEDSSALRPLHFVHESSAFFNSFDFCRESSNDGHCDLTIGISFFCKDKKIDLPTYTLQIKTDSDGYPRDEFLIYFAEFDERNIFGHYKVEKFLPPEDTSCGKFVNYAVLKVER